MDIYTFSSILEVIFLISIAIMIFLLNDNHNKAALTVFITGIISLVFIVIASNRVEKGTFEAYTIPITHIQETEREEWGDKVIKITDDTDSEKEVAINETKYDANTTYVEMKRFKWLFIYEDKNILHIKAN